MPPVKTEIRPNWLPESYRRRLMEAGITQYAVAQASARFHPKRRKVTDQFVNRVLVGRSACPDWLRKQLDRMLKAAGGA